jgi:hypothetical protein
VNWYDNIEEPVRDLVKYLRNEGINTTCSCGHDMYIEGDIAIDGFAQQLDVALFNYFTEHKIKKFFWYSIDVHIERLEGHIYSSFVVKLEKE